MTVNVWGKGKPTNIYQLMENLSSIEMQENRVQEVGGSDPVHPPLPHLKRIWSRT